MHYLAFHDDSVLPREFFTMNYRLIIGENEFFNINKTAFDYGNFLIDNEIFPPQLTAESSLSVEEHLTEEPEIPTPTANRENTSQNADHLRRSQ